MFQTAEESVGESNMVTNVELAKEVNEQKERNRLLEETLELMRKRLDEVAGKVTGEAESSSKGEVVAEEDVIPEPDPPIQEEPFLKAIKALSGKALEGVPVFAGKMDTELVMEWIEGMENHFDCEGVTEAEKVKVAKSRLRGAALTWWKFLQEERKREGKKPIANWQAMVTKIKENYLPEDYEIQLHKKRQSLKQKDLDVAAYTEEFHKLCLRSRVQEEEAVKVARYTGGLRANIQEEISLWAPTTVHKCFQLALKVEERNKKRQESNSNRGRGRGFHRGGYKGRDNETKTQEDSKPVEQNHHNNNHRGGYQRGRNSYNGGRGRHSYGGRGSHFATMKCYNCGNLGHPAYRCPDKPSSSQGERRNNYVQEDQVSCHNQEVNLDSEKGENLMFRRILLKEPSKEEPKERRSLFRVKCKILGKVCKVIVDSGSMDNIISEEAVQKLQLVRTPHDHPYRVTWLNKGHKVLVNEQAWVDFSIGGYQDRILCDILPMDACHLLLGRPWQYDRDAVYHGKKNLYTFKKDGTTFKIQSLIEDGDTVTDQKLLLMSGKEFLKDFKEEEEVGFVVLLKPREEEIKKPNVLPEEVQDILDKYRDIISNGTLATLPPQRAVSHQIDFVPGASLPNKAAYKMTPE